MSVIDSKSPFDIGEIEFSEKKKAIDIYTAVNTLYFPHYFVRPCMINGEVKQEHYLVLSRNSNATGLGKALFIPLNQEILYTKESDSASHIVNGKKIQESLGITNNDYREALVCMKSNRYISSIRKKSLQAGALEIWQGNLEALEKISNDHPEFKGLATAVEVLNRSENKKMCESQLIYNK